MVIGHWDDYSVYLSKEPKVLAYILYEYTRALEDLRDRNPGYLEKMRLDPARGYKISPDYENKKNEASNYNRFIDIVDGFEMHIGILDKGPLNEETKKVKEESLRDFQAALCNGLITKYILGTDFTDEPCGKGR